MKSSASVISSSAMALVKRITERSLSKNTE
jgi:hypothetical protein